jgi:hypothetical protein
VYRSRERASSWTLGHLGHELGEKVVLALHAVVERRPGDAHRFGDVLEIRTGEPPLREDAGRLLEDLVLHQSRRAVGRVEVSAAVLGSRHVLIQATGLGAAARPAHRPECWSAQPPFQFFDFSDKL